MFLHKNDVLSIYRVDEIKKNCLHFLSRDKLYRLIVSNANNVLVQFLSNKTEE